LKNKLNILFIVTSLHFGGAEKHVVTLLNGLSRINSNFFLTFLKEDDSLLPQIKKDRLKEILFCHISSKLDLSCIRKLAYYIDSHDIDIVLCTNQYPMLYGVLAEKFAKKSAHVLIIFHTTLLMAFKDRLQMFIYRSFFKRCACVIFVSKNQEKYWLEKKHLPVQKSIAIQNGIDIKHFEFQLDSDQRHQLLQQLNFSNDDYIVGLCAALRYEKYHIDVIDAVAKARSKGVDVKFLIIGDGPERGNIERHVSMRKLADAVVITGFQEDVRPYIALCGCMVIASHSETFSIAALESMAMGKPMIMTDIGGASEQIEHGKNGFLYEKGDVEALTNYILQMSSKDLREQMGQQAFKSVREKFSLERMLKKYEDLFQNL